MKRTRVTGCRILTPFREIPSGEILMEEGKIRAVGPVVAPGYIDPRPCRKIDARGLTAVPGLVDVHVQGAGGADVLDGSLEALSRISATCARFGVTGFLATTVYRRGDENRHLEIAAAACSGTLPGASLLGIHLEGPFIAAGKRGMIQPDCLSEARQQVLEDVLARCGGALRMMTVAPELAGALGLIERLRAQGVVASFGHSQAGYAETRAGIAAGITHVTHLFNAMNGMHHRDPGPLPALWESANVTAQLICDGVHVSPPVLRLAAYLFGVERLVLITDGMQAMGLPEGRYAYRSLDYESRNGTTRYLDGTLIGTALGMSELIGRCRGALEWPLAEVLQTATINPTRALGIDARTGTLEEGKDADLVLLGPELEVRMTFVRGRLVHDAGTPREE
jgi:N-acetylglucosamine-6-phosphate deacetylase